MFRQYTNKTAKLMGQKSIPTLDFRFFLGVFLKCYNKRVRKTSQNCQLIFWKLRTNVWQWFYNVADTHLGVPSSLSEDSSPAVIFFVKMLRSVNFVKSSRDWVCLFILYKIWYTGGCGIQVRREKDSEQLFVIPFPVSLTSISLNSLLRIFEREEAVKQTVSLHTNHPPAFYLCWCLSSSISFSFLLSNNSPS
jgi:hypothetical protein